ncbi:hypothetical protein [Marinobacter sp. C18]|uniref:hypothetical protein n=1 Tax=Marinobacter sp. C18 TaxID=1772288 RepID=UPI0021164476|nr:hypothetical protein [Marinobacter sp. C18]
MEVAPDQIVTWLGFIERDIARSWGRRLCATEVALAYAGVEGWRRSELDAWQWISKESEAFVGFLVPEGVFAVVERGKPLLKRLSGVAQGDR